MKNAINSYNKKKKLYEELISGGKEEKDYKGREFKIFINWKRREGDKAMPTKVADLEKRYKEIKNRPDISQMEYLQNKGFMQDDSLMKNCRKGDPGYEAEKNSNEVDLYNE